MLSMNSSSVYFAVIVTRESVTSEHWLIFCNLARCGILWRIGVKFSRYLSSKPEIR
ncbi:hypothetical protein HanRHA438_Chr15g0688741 [Helianthus annuus]|nr:hypothetical protein HanHA89_Chr15g0599961 [Helianthus annuus]KAJ0843198.1 hypothetical protein HanRHA438_Chr15g0688741 [Helianthus annuus]